METTIQRSVEVLECTIINPSRNGVKVGDVVSFWGGNTIAQGSRRGIVTKASKLFLWVAEDGSEPIRWNREAMGFLGVVTVHKTLSDKGDRIRALFLDTKPSYSIEEISFLLDIPKAKILEQMTEMSGFWDIENIATKPGEIRLSRADVFRLVHVFDLSWSPVEIEEALGSEAASVIPEPLRMKQRTIALSNAVWRALENQWWEYTTQEATGEGRHAPSFERWLSWQIDTDSSDAQAPEDKDVMSHPELFLGKDAPGKWPALPTVKAEALDMRPGGPNVGNASQVKGPYTVGGVRI